MKKLSLLVIIFLICLTLISVAHSAPVATPTNLLSFDLSHVTDMSVFTGALKAKNKTFEPKTYNVGGKEQILTFAGKDDSGKGSFKLGEGNPFEVVDAAIAAEKAKAAKNNDASTSISEFLTNNKDTKVDSTSIPAFNEKADNFRNGIGFSDDALFYAALRKAGLAEETVASGENTETRDLIPSLQNDPKLKISYMQKLADYNAKEAVKEETRLNSVKTEQTVQMTSFIQNAYTVTQGTTYTESETSSASVKIEGIIAKKNADKDKGIVWDESRLRQEIRSGFGSDADLSATATTVPRWYWSDKKISVEDELLAQVKKKEKGTEVVLSAGSVDALAKKKLTDKSQAQVDSFGKVVAAATTAVAAPADTAAGDAPAVPPATTLPTATPPAATTTNYVSAGNGVSYNYPANVVIESIGIDSTAKTFSIKTSGITDQTNGKFGLMLNRDDPNGVHNDVAFFVPGSNNNDGTYTITSEAAKAAGMTDLQYASLLEGKTPEGFVSTAFGQREQVDGVNKYDGSVLLDQAIDNGAVTIDGTVVPPAAAVPPSDSAAPVVPSTTLPGDSAVPPVAPGKDSVPADSPKSPAGAKAVVIPDTKIVGGGSGTSADMAGIGIWSFGASGSASTCSAGGGSLSGVPLGPLRGPFEMIMTLLNNELSVFVLMFILSFILFYGVFYAALQKVTIFKENKQGKIVAVALSFMVNLAFFGLTGRYGGPQAVLARFLFTFEIFGGIILASVMFMIIYYGFRQDENSKNWKLAMGGAGLAMLLVGSMICAPSWTSMGFFIMFITLLSGGIMSLGSKTPEQQAAAAQAAAAQAAAAQAAAAQAAAAQARRAQMPVVAPGAQPVANLQVGRNP